MKPLRPWDDPRYRQRRAQLMASITETTRCWRCGKLAHEHPQTHKSGKRAGWQCGHTIDGRNDAPLAAEWSTCNAEAGGALGHHRAFGQYRPDAEPRTVEPHFPGHYNLIDVKSPGAPPCIRAGGSLCSTCADYRARSNPRT